MKTNLILLAIILGFTMLVTGFLKNKAPKIVQDTAPNFTYKTISGEEGALEDHQGKAVLLHFWATWCPPCIIEFPDLIDLAVGQKNNLIILAVSNDKNKSDIERFLKKLKYPLPPNFIIAQDSDKAISQELYGTYKLPESYLLKPDLSVFQKIIGPQESWNSDSWKQKIEQAVGE